MGSIAEANFAYYKITITCIENTQFCRLNFTCSPTPSAGRTPSPPFPSLSPCEKHADVPRYKRSRFTNSSVSSVAELCIIFYLLFTNLGKTNIFHWLRLDKSHIAHAVSSLKDFSSFENSKYRKAIASNRYSDSLSTPSCHVA